MSARRAFARISRRRIVAGAGALVVIAVAGFALAAGGEAGAGSSRLPASDHLAVQAKTAKEQAARASAPAIGHATEKRTTADALPTVSISPGATIVNTTDGLMDEFRFDLRTSETGVDTLTMSADRCLLHWAMATLPTRSDSASLKTEQVCGRTAAVLVGGYSTSVNDMVDRASAGDANDVKAVLFGLSALDYASVASDDGKAVLIVVARPAKQAAPNL
jgi:hypothetical protein